MIMFLEKMELYISAGLALDSGLILIRDGSSNKQKISIDKIIQAVQSGTSLSQALLKYIKISPTLAGLVEHGESSAKLKEAFLSARSILERQDELLKKCLSAMMYPCVIGLFAGLLTLGLIRGVMPQIIPMLKGLNVQLPLLTRIVMSISEGFIKYGLYIGIGLIISFVVISLTYKKFHSFRFYVQVFLLKIPIIGNLVHDYSISIFMRSCGSMIESGMSITEAYSKTISTISLLPLSKRFSSQTVEIGRGVSLSLALSEISIASYITSLISAGEASGTLGSSMIRVATIIDRNIEHMLKRLTSLVEPIMMAGMGCIVGAIALSIMMPIYDISRVLQK